MDKTDLIYDFELFAPNFLRIRTERGDIVPFKFNSAQLKFLAKIKERYHVDKIDIHLITRPDFALRMVVLKARQQGISTLVQALIFWALYILTNQKCLTMGHKTDASNNLFDMYNRYYTYLPNELKRVLLKSNEKKIQYAKNLSENKIDTAGAGEIGRSDNLHWLHLTEVAFYPDTKTTLVGLMQGAKYARAQFIESTANGYNDFHEIWDGAVKGENGFTPVFLSWLEFPDYVQESMKLGFIEYLDEDAKERFIKDLGNPRYNAYRDEEHILVNKYGATIEQLQWRRYMIASPAIKWDINKFHQEYPRDPEEAFVASGSAVFDQNKVQANYANSKEPIMRGDLVYKDLRDPSQGVEFIENFRGFISIWTEPEKVEGMYRFAAGTDVAEGLEQGDYSVITVLDRISNEVYLTWHGHIDADLLGEEIHKIWLYLNKDCYFNIEKNNHGLTTVVKAFELGVPLYSKESFTKGYEQRSGSDFGHVTSQKTKKRLVDTMIEWIREDMFSDYDGEFWKECMKFVRNPRGQAQADGKDRDPSVKNFDDRVISRGLAFICDLWMPSFTKTIQREPVARPSMLNRLKPFGKTKF